jgi:hypothetical protein
MYKLEEEHFSARTKRIAPKKLLHEKQTEDGKERGLERKRKERRGEKGSHKSKVTFV